MGQAGPLNRGCRVLVELGHGWLKTGVWGLYTRAIGAEDRTSA
jgi:hypothetical protein